MRRLIIFAFLWSIIIPAAIAETEIFKGSVITNSDLVVGQSTFKVNYDEKSNKVLVQTPAVSMIIDNGDCKSNDMFRICILGANFSDRNITTYISYYKVDLQIFQLTGKIVADRKNSMDTMLPGQQSVFTITLKNPTDFPITKISYSDDLSPFNVLQVNGCSLNGNVMYWKGSIAPKYDKTCTALIAAVRQGSFSLSANISYFNSYETINETEKPVLIKVLPKQINATYKMDAIIEAGTPFHFNISLKNVNPDEKIDYSATVELPKTIELLKDAPGFLKTGNILKQVSVLEPGSTKNFSIYLVAKTNSNDSIKVSYDYTIDSVKDLINDELYPNPIEPEPLINMTGESDVLAEGQKFVAQVKILNPSKFSEFKDIRATMEMGINKIVEKLDVLKPNEDYTIISNVLIVPENLDFGNSSNKTINIKLCLEFKLNGNLKLIRKSYSLVIQRKSQFKSLNQTGASNAVNVTNNTIKIQLTESKNQSQIQIKAAPASGTKEPNPIKNKLNKLVLVGVFVIILVVIVLAVVLINRKKGEGNIEEPTHNIQDSGDLNKNL